MDKVVDVDAVAAALVARRPDWAARGVVTADPTWRDAEAAWPQPLLTDRAAIVDPESFGLVFRASGEDVAQLVVWCGGWADLELVLGDKLIVEVPRFTDVGQVVAVADHLVDRIASGGLV